MTITDSRGGQIPDDTQTCHAAAGTTSPIPTHSRDGHSTHDTHTPYAAAGNTSNTDSRSSQRSDDTHRVHAAAGNTSPSDSRDGQGINDAHLRPAVAGTTTDLRSRFLALAADVLDDAETTRKADENRLRQLTRGSWSDERIKTGKYDSPDKLPPDKDGERRGFRLDETHPDVARLAALVDMLRKVEHQAELNLARLLRQHPLGPWVKAQKGVGEKQAARLLAVIGDPYVNKETGEPRTVSQLWAYCGHGDPGRRKFKGMTQSDLFTLGNPVAKSRVWLIATAVLKAGGGEEKARADTDSHTVDASLAAVYYRRKTATEGRLHATPCVRCGPSGHPAAEGTPWSDAHRHADALRVLGKHILRELWLEAKRIHDEQDLLP